MLIIEGNWEESENFLLPLKSNSNFQYNSAIKLIKLQQIYETIETRFDNLNQEEIIKQLKEIKDFLKEEGFKDLLNLLNKNSVKDIPKFNNWTVNRGRLKTFEQIKELFRVVYSNEKEDKIMKNNLLVNLLIKINGRGNNVNLIIISLKIIDLSLFLFHIIILFYNIVSKLLNDYEKPIVFLLWGKQAEKKKELIKNPHHLVLITSHPSPFSARRGFFGSNHFKMANEFLKENGLEEIDWKL